MHVTAPAHAAQPRLSAEGVCPLGLGVRVLRPESRALRGGSRGKIIDREQRSKVLECQFSSTRQDFRGGGDVVHVQYPITGEPVDAHVLEFLSWHPDRIEQRVVFYGYIYHILRSLLQDGGGGPFHHGDRNGEAVRNDQHFASSTPGDREDRSTNICGRLSVHLFVPWVGRVWRRRHNHGLVIGVTLPADSVTVDGRIYVRDARHVEWGFRIGGRWMLREPPGVQLHRWDAQDGTGLESELG
mmetsp:Transcript_60653/g.124875  ORF Transcript_60653/g.124875 Transcript_60653/m.124875 type:complete len:242 (-) Transcript_60653:1888-2613(-)